MPKLVHKKFKLKSIHLQAVIVLIIYNILSKANFAHALFRSTFLISFLQVYLFGVFATYIFLYFFNHEDFFGFAKEIEKKEQKGERKFVHKFHHYGKFLATIIIGSLGGPILLALTLRLFFHNSHKDILILIALLFSTLISFGLLKGLILL